MARKLRNEELGRIPPESVRNTEKEPLVIVLDNVRSMHNVGSAFRTADAFWISRLILCGVTGTPPHREIEKTALGATATVEWEYFTTTQEAVQNLRNDGFRIYAVEQAEGSISLQHFNAASNKTALIFGNEVYGVDQEIVNISDGVIEIPQSGTKHSLNVSVSIGVVLWELLRGRK